MIFPPLDVQPYCGDFSRGQTVQNLTELGTLPPDAEIKLAADFQSAADFRPQIGSGETGGQAVGTRSGGNRANLETSSDGQNDPQLWPPRHFATGNVLSD